MAIILDIETCAIADAAQYVKPASNLKDPAKIAASIEERAGKAALDPWLCRIIALGWCRDGEDIERVTVAPTEAIEASMLSAFWHEMWDLSSPEGWESIVTFNGSRFDLQVLNARALILGLDEKPINVDRYRSPHKDLLRILSGDDKERMHSLTFYCQRLGIPTDDAFSGSHIAQLYADGDWESIKRHCASDVRLTRLLAERMGVLKAPVRGMIGLVLAALSGACLTAAAYEGQNGAVQAIPAVVGAVLALAAAFYTDQHK